MFDVVNKVSLRFCVVAFLFALLTSASAQVVAIKGEANLSDHSFDEDGVCNLSGTWEFYWGELLTPQDFVNIQPSSKLKWIQVPGAWHKQGDYTLSGYATYRLRLLVPAKTNSLALYFPAINSSSKIWINGKLEEETGTVTKVKDNYIPRLAASVISINQADRYLDIIIQVANFSNDSGGIISIPKFGEIASIIREINRANGVDNFFVGGLITMFIFQLLLAFVYRTRMQHLWLALICLTVALRAMTTHGSFFLPSDLFQQIDWKVWQKLNFLCAYAVVALFPLYVRHLFPDDAPKKPILWFCLVSFLLCVAEIVIPQYIAREIVNVSLLCSFIYAVYSIFGACASDRKDAKGILVGVLVVFLFVLVETLRNSSIEPFQIHFKYFVELGVLLFLFFQTFLLAYHHVKEYISLEGLNQNLEKIITERTGQLIKANSVKDRLLSLMSHDIKSPLNSLRGILNLFNKGTISADEFRSFTNQVENDLSKTNILVENILYWTRNQLKGNQVNKEKVDLTNVIEENFRLFESVSASKKIVIKHNITSVITITTDINILNFVIRNLISNSVKFSYENSEINILISKTNDAILIQVKDQGIVIDDLILQTLMNTDLSDSDIGTGKETSIVLWLLLCREYLQKLGGMLNVEATKEKGNTYNILLPFPG